LLKRYIEQIIQQIIKSRKNFFTGITVLASLATLIITACNKTGDATTVNDQVSIYLTDDPAFYDNVSVDIRYVEVKIQEGHKNEDHVGDKDDDDDDHFDDNDKDSDNDRVSKDQYGKWDTLAIRPGVYDILKFKNGIDTLFAKGAVNGRVRKIRITLGDKNSIVSAGVTSPLALHSSINNYLYIRTHNRHHDDLGVNHIGFWIDFDIANSIVEQGGRFYLKPLLKPFCDNQFGKVLGRVFPADAHTLVKIFNTIDGATAIPEKSGEYKMRGLTEGTYKVTFKGANGYLDTTINDIKIVKGKETRIPDITLHK
jgi:hypothetical protein